MGLLTTGGPPMRWGTPENDKAIPYVRAHGIEQFLNIYRRYKDLSDMPFLWGEEIEHMVMTLSEDGKDVKLSLTAQELLNETQTATTDSKWLPEYGSFMIETTPAEPYNLSQASLLSCEAVIQRRYDLLRMLTSKPGDRRVVTTLVAFPLMGQPNFIDSPTPLPTKGQYAASLFVPDDATNQTHPRFGNLTRNIRLRRGRKVCIQVPLFIDERTREVAVDTTFGIDRHPANTDIDCQPATATDSKTAGFDDDDDEAAAKKTADDVHDFTHLYTPASDYYLAQYGPEASRVTNVTKRYEACPCPVPSVNHPCVYMDSMAFGMGMSCLQVTMQFPNVDIGRHVFDQLTTLCPMFLALTAATPIQKGHLVDSDVRWMTIAASVDCRQRREVPRIVKSRYDSVSLYISPRPSDLSKFNDNHVETDADVKAKLQAEGIDERLATHFSHLFIRDPLVIYEGRVEALNDAEETDHFENIQSTNWQTVRFKPPPFNSPIGWRVEFRVMEVSMTAFENAAFSVFIVLLTKAIMKFDLWLYIPMSKVDQNMGRAHQRDAVKEKYWFTKNTSPDSKEQGEAVELTMDQLFNGCDDFAGFIPVVRRYVREEKLNDPRFEQYFELIGRRAAGTLQTTAAFMRSLVTTHPDYQKDSIVRPSIAHDLVRVADDISAGKLAFDSFLPATLLAHPEASASKRPATQAAPSPSAKKHH